MEFRLLGRLEVQADGVDLTPARPKQRALLALLLLRAGETVATDDLVDALWGRRPPETAQTALHGHVSALRKRLGAQRIETRSPGYRLLLADGDDLDAQCFERIVAAARLVGPSARSQQLRKALALYRGEPLSDFRYEEFAAAEALRLEERRLAVVEELIDAELALDRHAEVIPELERLVAGHPFHERLRAQLMLALYGAGRQADALQAFQDGRSLLVDELGIEPGPGLQRVERQILNHDPELAAPDTVAREKSRARVRANLPTQSTSLIGREREIREVKDLLRRSDVSLVTLTGTGGTGKTRVAIQVAAGMLDEFADGVLFIGLAPLRDPSLVLPTAARILGVRARRSETLVEDLARHLRGRELLLVFDNFEHVLAAATSVAEMAASAADVKLLVTSRAPLRLSAERVYPVLPLETPDGDADIERVLRCESVALFEARAQAVQPDFALTPANAPAVAGICKDLDGLPLAIELAATRVGTLPPAALRHQLDHPLKLLVGGARDTPERQRTLRATIDWSYDLLQPAEKRLFVRLGVFSGGCTIDAAQRVVGDDFDVVDGLGALSDNGLTRVEGTDEEPRFSMLETIREYAVERLNASAEAPALHRRHADYFLGLAERGEPNLIGIGGHAEWLDRFEREHANFRAAMDWLEVSGECDSALRLAAALWRFWDQRGHLLEARHRLERVLGADRRPTAPRAKALCGAADIALTSGDVAMGGVWAEEALEIFGALGDSWGVAFSLLMHAYAVGQTGSWRRAVQLYAESAQRFRDCGDEHYALRASRSLSWAYEQLGDLHRAREVAEDNLARSRATGDEYIQGITLSQLADYAVEDGRLEESLSLMRESHRILRGLNDLLLIAAAVGRFASVLAHARRAATAAEVLSSSTVLMEEIGAGPPWFAKIREKTLVVIKAELDEASFAAAWERGKALTADEAVALTLESFDVVAPPVGARATQGTLSDP